MRRNRCVEKLRGMPSASLRDALRERRKREMGERTLAHREKQVSGEK